MRRIAVATLIIGFSILSFPATAFAPPMVANEIASQRELGYEICEPTISQLPEDLRILGVSADAIPTPYGDVCELRFSHSITVEELEWISWHEVCHLSTMNEIYSDPHMPIIDPAHAHDAFQWCIAQGPSNSGGYLQD